jgi:hypothetical protein
MRNSSVWRRWLGSPRLKSPRLKSPKLEGRWCAARRAAGIAIPIGALSTLAGTAAAADPKSVTDLERRIQELIVLRGRSLPENRPRRRTHATH